MAVLAVGGPRPLQQRLAVGLVQLQRPVAVGDGAAVLLGVVVGGGAVGQEEGGGGPQLDRPGVVADRLLRPALGQFGVGLPVVQVGVVRVQFQRPAERLDGPRVVLAFEQGAGPLEPGRAEVGPQPQGGVGVLQGGGRVAALQLADGRMALRFPQAAA